ncbi:CaiB/BaiF CoA transferase family protein [Afipia birgiae]|uniref:CaiB/BaiF CoA transferase family protein n=1 Tax=Afipia birgiae TaxID=151414 RepID=UPI00031B4A5F|nr:CaiB/BaiF CoA-transferase family protein [Afipia birgiae]
MSILEGIKVIELCEVYQGPLAGQTLADYGARVIKVERPPVGDPMRLGDFYAAENNLMSGYYAAVNRNKECVCLDLKNDEGRAALLELLKTADVVLHNYRPGVMERLGFGYEELSEINPRLIYAAASGFGETGPLAEMAGQDLVIQSISGIAMKNARASGVPSYLNVPLTDYASGLLLVQGILLALIERGKSGVGQKVTSSLFDAAVAMQSLEAASILNYGYETRWFDRAPNFPVETSDGWITVLGFFRDNPLQLVCQALSVPDLSAELNVPLANDQIDIRDKIVERLTPEFRKFKAADIVARLQKVGILAAPVLSFEQTLALPQVENNRLIVTVPVEGQPDMKLVDQPLKFSRSQRPAVRAPGKLGAQTRTVLAEHGFDEARIEKASGLPI